ncbi:unnamed protein product, partial [Oppiella nova]
QIIVIVLGAEYSDGVCYGDLGCFNITADFKHILYRPYNVLPEPPDKIQTKIYLYTRSQPQKPLSVANTWIVDRHLNTNNKQKSALLPGRCQQPFSGRTDSFTN